MSKARNESITAATQEQIGRLRADGWYHSIRLPDGSVTPGHLSEEQLQARLARFPIPEDLTGKRVLDVGAWDGWFSFEMERRGASVVAVDIRECETFQEARRALGSKVEYRIDDVVDITPERYGKFDVVLFLGVLYHLKHPLLALERVCAVSRDLVCVESYVTNDSIEVPAAMEFYEGRELCGQFDNWVGPNLACLLAFCRTAGFARVELASVVDQRAHVACFRKHEARGTTGEAPRIVAVERGGEYGSIWFKSPVASLTPANVYLTMGEFGSKAVIVDSTGGDGWLANFLVPPGLDDGWHDVRIAVGDGPWSEAFQAGVAVPFDHAESLEVVLVTDGKTWEPNLVRRGADACISLWVRGLSQEEGVEVLVGERGYPALFVSRPDEKGLRQVNCLLPGDLTEVFEVAVRCGGSRSAGVTCRAYPPKQLLKTSGIVK